MLDPEQFKLLMPAAITWAEERQAEILTQGMPLTDFQLELARAVGVARPDKIRMIEVAEIPVPADEALRVAGKGLGLFDWSPAGRAIGYGVEIRLPLAEGPSPRKLSPTLYRHEFRHVFQFEQYGSIALYLPEYLRAVLECGYFDSPFEVDARRYEAETVPGN